MKAGLIDRRRLRRKASLRLNFSNGSGKTG